MANTASLSLPVLCFDKIGILGTGLCFSFPTEVPVAKFIKIISVSKIIEWSLKAVLQSRKKKKKKKYLKKETKQHSQDLMLPNSISLRKDSRTSRSSTSLFCTTDLVLNEINLMQIDNFMTDGPAHICNHKQQHHK
uniref:Uncharacterized protein n=1 Tax=Glossina austeni TaxID=7395 RepID=A0A1A9V7U2_GLOAU